MKASWIVLGVLVGVPACGKDEGVTASEGTSSGKTEEAKAMSEAQQSVVDAWGKAGLKASAMTASATAFGKNCSAGTIDKIEVVICEYGNADEAKKAEKPGLDWVGGTTGAAWASGSLVIAVADRKKSDPQGKTINQLMKSTPK